MSSAVHRASILAAAVAAFWASPPGAGAQAEHAHPMCGVDGAPGRGLYGGQRWPGGVVPYEFRADVSEFNRQLIRGALDVIESRTPVRFVPRQSETIYILVQPSPVPGVSFSSHIGMSGGQQTVSISDWDYQPLVIHEFCHALGMYHEHQRPDRDQYIEINWSAIDPQYSANFSVVNAETFGPYDFESVMHYFACAFTNCQSCWPFDPDCATIIARPPYTQWQGQMGINYLSDGDVATLIRMYAPATSDCADATGDGVVDLSDLQQVLVFFGAAGPAVADLDSDGVVGFSDLNMVLVQFGQPCSRE